MIKWPSFTRKILINGKTVTLDGCGNVELLTKAPPRIAIVGTRSPSTYGRKICREWSAEFAQAGITLVTGAAAGIDITATKAFHDAGSASMQVLPAPLSRMMELSTRVFLQELLNKRDGNIVVLSQFTEMVATDTGQFVYPPINKGMFVKRNDTIALFADAVLVIEAAGTSGAFHTVWAANKYGIPVFAVPGRVGDDMSLGCNLLIANKEATLAVSTMAVMAAIQNRRASCCAEGQV